MSVPTRDGFESRGDRRESSRADHRASFGTYSYATEYFNVSDALYFPIYTLYMATAKEPLMAQPSAKPVKVFRLRGVSASVFQNHAKRENRDVTFHKVSLQRTYKDGDEFKQTSTFSRDDLPVCMHVMQQAWAYILDVESKRNGVDEE
jgi:hypothetical protein